VRVCNRTTSASWGRFKVAGATPTPFTVAPAGAACCLVQIRDASTKIRGAEPARSPTP